MTLTEFLLSRIAEDEDVAQSVLDRVQNHGYLEDATGSDATIHFDLDHLQGGVNVSADRMLAECDAKRRIVAECGPESKFWNADVLAYLALPYAAHEDYREEWKP